MADHSAGLDENEGAGLQADPVHVSAGDQSAAARYVSTSDTPGSVSIADGNGNYVAAATNVDEAAEYRILASDYSAAAQTNEQDASHAPGSQAQTYNSTAYGQSAEAAAFTNAANAEPQNAAAAAAAVAGPTVPGPLPGGNGTTTVQETPGGPVLSQPTNTTTPTTSQTTQNNTTGGSNNPPGSNELSTAGVPGINLTNLGANGQQTSGGGSQDGGTTGSQDQSSGGGQQIIGGASGVQTAAPVSSSNEQQSSAGQGGGSGGVPPYKVVPGDTLSSIADKYHVSLGALEAANPTISNPNLIFPGNQINIPEAAQGSYKGGTGSADGTGVDASLKNATIGGAATAAEKSIEDTVMANPGTGTSATKHSTNYHGA
jgi:LysM repeat protein